MLFGNGRSALTVEIAFDIVERKIEAMVGGVEGFVVVRLVSWFNAWPVNALPAACLGNSRLLQAVGPADGKLPQRLAPALHGVPLLGHLLQR